ncbi:hypothetical protein [Pseudomonas viridiflava]|uniref:hypothetical protein n=1 Tax=Pseudomonas viridiflava TaxID=33069 RepID=UPI000F011E79|nr:hypothetical protein [Pseudomonas viridiflava]
MKSGNTGHSVEGSAIELQCRKYHNLLPFMDKALNRMVYPFKLSIFGKVKIVKVLDDGVVPISESSMIALGDEIMGESIGGHCAKALPKPQIINATASHKASFIKTRGHSYARLDTGMREVIQSKSLLGPVPLA